LRKKINTYEPTDVNYHGGLKHGANIHSVSVQVNQYVWDMMRVLDQHELYGFDFEAKIGENKTIVILRHEEKEALKKARKVLKDSQDESDFVFLTKVIKKKSNKTMWIILAIVLVFALFGRFLWFLYEEDLISFSNSTPSPSPKVISTSTPVVEDIEIDVEKLKAFKESFAEQNSTIDDATMRVMEITTSVIASFVSDEEKAKYSSKNLVENFKGKSGIHFVAKDGNLSKDFNATVKELNVYAQNFVKDANISLALQCFDKALELNTSSKDELLQTLANQGELYENIGQIQKVQESYSKILELNPELKKEEFVKYGLINAVIHSKLAKIYEDLNQTKLAKESLKKAEIVYKSLLVEFRKRSKDGKIEESQLAWALNYLANFYADDKKEYAVSIEIRKEAISIYKKLSETNPKKFALFYYKTLNSLGKSYLLRNEMNLASKTYTRALNIAKEVLKQNLYKALSFRALAMVEIKNKNFINARNYYNDALKIYKKLVHKNSKLYNPKLIEIYACFAYLEKEKGNYVLAGKRYKKVILAYKKMNKEKPLEYNLQIAKALNELAFIQIAYFKNFMEAEIKLFEAVSVVKRVKKIEQKRARKILAESYRSLAYLAILEKNMQAASDYYKKAYSLKKF
jgi:tetratricopeptide (TPR) repeat protein